MQANAKPQAGRQVRWLPMSEIRPNPAQPRKEFDDFLLVELAASIRRFGLLQPITVRPVEGGYEIIMGERRFRACAMLGYTHIDALVLPTDSAESALMALVENLQRANLNFFEEAEAYAELLKKGMTQEALAQALGKSTAAVANKVRLLKLDDETRAYVQRNGLTERHARALLRLPDAPARLRVAQKAAQERLTVQKTEAHIDALLRALPPAAPPSRRLISLMRDHRLYVNAIKGIVKQMRDAGLRAQYTLSEFDDSVEIRVVLPKLR